MPLYEYVCPSCHARFDKLQPMNASSEAPCPDCGQTAKRALSLFAAVSQGPDGSSIPITGGGCAGCAGGSCSTCSVN